MEITLEIYNCFLSQKQLFTSWADEVQLECVMSTGLWDSLMLKIEQHWSQWCCVFCSFGFSWLPCANLVKSKCCCSFASSNPKFQSTWACLFGATALDWSVAHNAKRALK